MRFASAKPPPYRPLGCCLARKEISRTMRNDQFLQEVADPRLQSGRGQTQSVGHRALRSQHSTQRCADWGVPVCIPHAPWFPAAATPPLLYRGGHPTTRVVNWDARRSLKTRHRAPAPRYECAEISGLEVSDFNPHTLPARKRLFVYSVRI